MRRFALSSRLTGPVLPVLAAGVLSAVMAVGDVTISVVDATPTARHDGTLPGLGQTVFSADVHVGMTDGDAWISGGIGMLRSSRKPGVFLYYALDPNTNEPVLTAPGFDNDSQTFATFMSEPRGQSQRGRFGADAAVGLIADYWDGGPVAEAEPDWLDLTYLESPVTFTQGSGFTQRVTIDISASAYAGRDVYAAVDGPSDPSHILLVGFESAAGNPWATRRWGFFAVPEPMPGLLLAGGVVVIYRLRRRGVRHTCIVALAASSALHWTQGGVGPSPASRTANTRGR